ncbi:hypothetical protein [Mesobacillus maritimus]
MKIPICVNFINKYIPTIIQGFLNE